jgi:7,8-dihydropterin-6-yl-methyl-4-(beta-D-ribofuranosyl)aminobenzene 5'-phosphate synthase
MIAKHISMLLVALAGCLSYGPASAQLQANNAQSVVVTILSSNLADGSTVGEWGFSALVQVDGRCLLFDAGRHPDTVLKNAQALDIDLACVTDVVLSHFHFDHTTGLLRILREARRKNPDALRRIHVAEGFFLSRRMAAAGSTSDQEANAMIAMRTPLETAGVEFIEYSQHSEVMPGVWVTGPVARRHPETNYPKTIRVNIDGRWVEDYVPESQGLTVVTASGPIVLLGCGHSGAVNLLEQVQSTIQDRPIHALMGGMHLFSADDQTLGWTADRLRDIGVEHLMAGHCTGIEPLFRLRTTLNLTRRTAVVGAVGSRFVYGEGIHPTAIAQ